ncbi:MAG TPA: hypothetical protein DEF18_12740 [Muricauda sp.]|uniref:DUF7793 domain-containing protein n=1 Tax=Flagellimonas aurea TaxID=2915619 RepID=A0ABS3FZY0_9FLAO|nr:hypothetical protein [Allomuricauda aurea]MAO15973.1 hypothetical protein [Allomuricauda sp.]MBO0352702.1 hypothetical protein [Allomuricauda aurea]HBU78960.1 hypothetical protein [Allomuricauda sp.]|tara:strand:+ start:1425 stop:1814 length:390 start_codon:yes stop_codon:yes gene_type:complete
MKRFVETEIATMWIEKDILFFIWKEQAYIDLSGAKKVVAQRIRLQQGKPYHILCSLKGLKNVDKDAWRYLANEGTGLIKCLVLVATTPLEQAFSKFIITKISTVSTQVFEDIKEAERFIVHNLLSAKSK